jgi:hypothetical protein
MSKIPFYFYFLLSSYLSFSFLFFPFSLFHFFLFTYPPPISASHILIHSQAHPRRPHRPRLNSSAPPPAASGCVRRCRASVDPPSHRRGAPPTGASPSAMEAAQSDLARTSPLPVPADLLSITSAGLLQPPVYRTRRPWRCARARRLCHACRPPLHCTRWPPPAASPPRSSAMEARSSSSAGHAAPPALSAPNPSLLCPVSTALVGHLWAPEGKRWKVGAEPQAEWGELRFSAPSRRNDFNHRDFREILSRIRFHQPFGRD